MNGEIPVGGQIDPSLIVGVRFLWKNAQKNEINTSEIINRIIPHRRPLATIFV
jgi:hypothetical protein